MAQNDPQDLESRLNIAKLHAALGVVLARTGRYAEARQRLSTALSGFDELLRVRPQDAEVLYVSRMTRDNLAAFKDCVGGHECKGLRSTQLPNLNN